MAESRRRVAQQPTNLDRKLRPQNSSFQTRIGENLSVSGSRLAVGGQRASNGSATGVKRARNGKKSASGAGRPNRCRATSFRIACRATPTGGLSGRKIVL